MCQKYIYLMQHKWWDHRLSCIVVFSKVTNTFQISNPTHIFEQQAYRKITHSCGLKILLCNCIVLKNTWFEAWNVLAVLNRIQTFRPRQISFYLYLLYLLFSVERQNMGESEIISLCSLSYLKEATRPWTTLGWTISKKGLPITIHSFSHGWKRIPIIGRLTTEGWKTMVSGHLWNSGTISIFFVKIRPNNFQKVHRFLESSRSLLMKIFVTVTTQWKGFLHDEKTMLCDT